MAKVPAHIYIGGLFPRTLIPQFIDIVHEMGIGSGGNYSESFEDDQFRTEEDVLVEVDHNQHVHLMDVQADNARMEALETFLRRSNIAYNRYGDACPGEWDADVSFFRQDDDDETTLVTNDEGEPMIPALAATTAYKALLGGNVHAALTALAPYEDYEVPPLPPFQLVDG
jgi:hypothetical protein